MDNNDPTPQILIGMSLTFLTILIVAYVATGGK